MANRKGKTESGFEYSVDDKVIDDMELVEDLAAADAGDNARFISAITKILGEKQKAKLYDHLRNKQGRVPVEAVGNEIKEILTALGEDGKN